MVFFDDWITRGWVPDSGSNEPPILAVILVRFAARSRSDWRGFAVATVPPIGDLIPMRLAVPSAPDLLRGSGAIRVLIVW